MTSPPLPPTDDSSEFYHKAFLGLFNLAVGGFFREIKTRGTHKIPPAGTPVIFVVAPHANQFVDPIMLLTTCGRKVGFLVAAKSMRKSYISFFGNRLGAIPVERPQDLVKKGRGKIHVDAEDTAIIRGIDTKFTEDLHPRDCINLPNKGGTAEVYEILSDTSLKIKKPFDPSSAIYINPTAENAPAITIDYTITPHLDQSEMFDAVVHRLAEGKCVGIFPEGGSHDRTEFLPLKAGAAIMALSAMAKHPNLKVKIVPVGLNYFNADRFRSRAVIEYGYPIDIPVELVQQYKAGGNDKRIAIAWLLDTIYTSLKAITVTTPDYETLMVIQAARRLYKPAKKKLDLDQNLYLARKFAEGYMKFKDDPRVKTLTDQVLRYNRLLKYYGIRDHEVNKTGLEEKQAMKKLVVRVAELAVYFFLGLPGAILTLPIGLTAKAVATNKMIEAKASSSVKIKGLDVVATWKVLTTIFMVPIFLTFYTFTAFFISYYGFDNSFRRSFTYAWIVSMILPFFTWATIRCYDNGIDKLKSLRPLYMASSSNRSSKVLRSMRAQLRADIIGIVAELGPEAFGPEFKNNRMFMDDEEYDRVSPSQKPSSDVGSERSSTSTLVEEEAEGHSTDGSESERSRSRSRSRSDGGASPAGSTPTTPEPSEPPKEEAEEHVSSELLEVPGSVSPPPALGEGLDRGRSGESGGEKQKERERKRLQRTLSKKLRRSISIKYGDLEARDWDWEEEEGDGGEVGIREVGRDVEVREEVGKEERQEPVVEIRSEDGEGIRLRKVETMPGPVDPGTA